MMGEMVGDEALDEPVAMIIAFLPAQRERLAGLRGRGLERVGMELAGEERVAGALIDQDRAGPGDAAHQQARIPILPTLAVRAEIVREGLLTPGHRDRVRNRREGRDRMPEIRVAQRRNERAMPAHGMTEDAAALRIDRELRLDQRWQLAIDVAAHAVMRRPGLGRGVEIESGTSAEIPIHFLARDV